MSGLYVLLCLKCGWYVNGVGIVNELIDVGLMFLWLVLYVVDVVVFVILCYDCVKLMILYLLVMSFVIWIVVLFDFVLVLSSSVWLRLVGVRLVRCVVRLMIGCDSILLNRWLSLFVYLLMMEMIFGWLWLSIVFIWFDVKLRIVWLLVL